MPTIAPGPSRDQSTLKRIVSLAMISPARAMATRPTTIAEALGPFGREGALILSLLGLSLQAAPIRLVLVDDHRMFRSGVKAELDESMVIVGEAADVDAAIVVVAQTRPDVVLLDVHLPGGNGNGGSDVISGSHGVTAESGEPVRFLALSVSDAAEDVIAVIRAGARGYVTKTINGNDLTTAIRRVADGDAVFSPRLAGFVLDAFGAAAGEVAVIDEELDRLSAREREVMRLIARGYQYKEVAKELFNSIKTVERLLGGRNPRPSERG